MDKNYIYENPLDFAIQTAIESLGDSAYDKRIKSYLERSAKVYNAIIAHGISITGMTYGKFCDQFEQKRNVIFLSDEEMELFSKAIRIMNILDE